MNGPLGIILIVVLLLVLFGAFPGVAGHSYGYWPSGGAGLLLVIVLLVLLLR